MCPISSSRPVQTQETLFCLQCRKPLILIPGMVFEVSDNAGVFLGYLHKNCWADWEENSPGSVVEPLTET